VEAMAIAAIYLWNGSIEMLAQPDWPMDLQKFIAWFWGEV